MSILLFALLVLILVALVLWAISFLPLPSPINGIVSALIILIGVVAIAQRAGVF